MKFVCTLLKLYWPMQWVKIKLLFNTQQTLTKIVVQLSVIVHLQFWSGFKLALYTEPLHLCICVHPASPQMCMCLTSNMLRQNMYTGTVHPEQMWTTVYVAFTFTVLHHSFDAAELTPPSTGSLRFRIAVHFLVHTARIMLPMCQARCTLLKTHEK